METNTIPNIIKILFPIIILGIIITLVAMTINNINEINNNAEQCREEGKFPYPGNKCLSIDEHKKIQEEERLSIEKKEHILNMEKCSDIANSSVKGAMSNTWGNTEYNTEYPSKIINHVFDECIKGLNKKQN